MPTTNQENLLQMQRLVSDLVDDQRKLHLRIQQQLGLGLPATADRLVMAAAYVQEAINFTKAAITALKHEMIADGENFEE